LQASTACVTTLQNQPALSCPSADIPQTHSTSMLCIEVMLLRDLPWACSCCAHHASLLRSNAERKLIAHAAASSKCFNVHREHLCSAWSLNGLPGLCRREPAWSTYSNRRFQKARRALKISGTHFCAPLQQWIQTRDVGLPSQAIVYPESNITHNHFHCNSSLLIAQ